MDEVEIALFPIPGSVSLPFSKVPLHVFEPRYRKMIKDSVSAKRRIGVAHTQKVTAERKFKANASLEEMLNHNQKTYLAHPVFSAGFAEIVDTLPDGRMLIEIAMDSRYEISTEVQAVPYKIVLCRPFDDDTQPSGENLRHELDKLLLGLTDETTGDLKNYLESDEWRDQSLAEYSFKIYSVVHFEPNVLQKVLELKSATARILFLKDVLTGGVLS